MTAFPRTEIAGVSISRMIIGSNWMLGYSHTSTAADEYINLRNRNREAIAELLGTFLEAGVDTFMGPLAANPVALDGAKLAEDKTGKKLILIDTPMINVDDTPEGRRETEKIFDAVKARVAPPFACPTIIRWSSWCASAPKPSTGCRTTCP